MRLRQHLSLMLGSRNVGAVTGLTRTSPLTHGSQGRRPIDVTMRPFEPAPAGVPYRNIPARPFQPPTVSRDPLAPHADMGKDVELMAELAKLTSSAPLEHYFSNLHRLLAKALKAPIMVVGVRDFATAAGFKMRFKRDAWHPDVDPVIDQRFIDMAVQTAKPVLHAQVPKLPTGGFLLQSTDSVGSLMTAPLIVENQVLGYIALRNPNEGTFDDQDLARFAAAASQTAMVVRNELTSNEASARRAELSLMLETARLLAAERDITKFFAALHGIVGSVMDAESFFVALGSWNNGGKMLMQYCVHHHRRMDAIEPLAINGSVSGHVFREGMPLILRSQLEFRNYAVVEQGARDQVQSGIVMPLQNGHRVIGVISAQSSKPNAYSVRERDLLEVLGELCAIAIETSRNAPMSSAPETAVERSA